ncbi:MAG: cyanophycinase [Planctomycetes bacterium]|nr:cyanophycinase [Planctomycetota bacterium]
MKVLISVVLTGFCATFLTHRAAAAEPNAVGLSAQAVANKGTLFILGGGKAPDPVYQEFVRLSGGRKARIVLITSAYAYRDEEHVQRRFGGWRSMGADSLVFLDAKSREEADSAKFVIPLTKATAVWIAGGSQSRLMSLCSGTKTEQAVRDVLNRGGVVGGTSAGAAAMSQLMIRYGYTSAVLGQGIGLLSGAVVDQHFSQRGRYGRLLGVLDEHPGLLGIGIDERTAAIVQGNTLRVLGESQVAVCVPAPGQATMVYRFRPNQQADLSKLRGAVALAK